MYDIRLERIRTALEREGVSTLSFNYKSVNSALEDAKYYMTFAREGHEKVILVGYSFGGVIASNLCGDGLIMISPLRRIEGYRIMDCRVPKLMVVARMDQFVPFEESMEIFEELSEPKEIVVLETDHFYTGKFDELVRSVVEFVKRLTESFI